MAAGEDRLLRHGHATGPAAIIAASRQIELFEEETLVDFQQSPRLHVLPPIAVDADMPEDRLPEHLAATARYIAQFRERFLLTLGGEHLLTYGVVTGLVEDPADVTIVQIDAHADLADTLGGRRWSHGTVMRRLWERGCRLVQVGIRSLSRPEYELVQSGPRIETFFAHELPARWDELLQLLARLEGPVYLSFDVDGLDPSIIPSTGTPQPGGLSWPQAMEMIRAVINAPCDLIGRRRGRVHRLAQPARLRYNCRALGDENPGVLVAARIEGTCKGVSRESWHILLCDGHDTSPAFRPAAVAILARSPLVLMTFARCCSSRQSLPA